MGNTVAEGKSKKIGDCIMIKAIFFDIDGTLLSHRSGSVPASTKESIRQLKEKGIKIFAATGRHMLQLEKLPVKGLPFDGYVTLNGQICMDANKAILYEVPIEPRDTEKMTEVFEQMELPVMIIEQNRMYINFIDSMVEAAQKAISTPVPETGIYTGEKVYQYIAYGKEENVQSLAARLSDCKMTKWNPYGFDIIPEKGGKVAGIRQMLEYFGIRKDETMAFGDGGNDTDMLRYAAVGIAMGNADKEVKEQADYVTSDIDQDGIWHALRHFNILENPFSSPAI